MSALITAKSKNPVMLLDEIDKLSSDYKGDPTSAMKHLYDSGKKLVLATSKPTEFSRDIIERYGILDCFYDVCGSTLDNSRTDKDAVIAYAMEKNHITDPADIIMVGDRKYDIIGARKNGIDCIAVTYGYGSLEEIRKSHPTYTVHSVEELDKLFSDSKF